MEYLALGLAVVVIVFFLLFIRTRKPKIKSSEKRKPIACCPLCGMQLYKGETIISKVFRPMNVPDQRCTVSGCPHCYPVAEPGIKRVCPVCKKSVPQSGYLVSRLFNRAEGKKHVMIVGCSECLKGEKRD